MACGACVGTVERAVLALDSVAGASVSLLTNGAEVTLAPGVDPTGAAAARIVQAIEDIGFDATHLKSRTIGADDGPNSASRSFGGFVASPFCISLAEASDKDEARSRIAQSILALDGVESVDWLDGPNSAGDSVRPSNSLQAAVYACMFSAAAPTASSSNSRNEYLEIKYDDRVVGVRDLLASLRGLDRHVARAEMSRCTSLGAAARRMRLRWWFSAPPPGSTCAGTWEERQCTHGGRRA